MWEQITTLSEIDTVETGTLIANGHPVSGNTPIYKVSGKNENYITLVPQNSTSPDEGLTIAADELFDKGWWMMKTH
ncbi:hypothetical protein I5907_11365 [Panacibacter sp. DH6]|uniref:Uncharacterized protein n=1 Tax=Panacibacter microcysteis TaxID=2793269 RepID=A0A931E829_9BACT|nr:hypothetical protein [Panacibacter microcysteis]MBG9376838.1 hypothetical protein [Panacibacter microcysteis]